MRAQIVILLLASLLMAGCTLPFRDNGASAMPQLIAPKPGCAQMTMDLTPASMGPGQQMTVSVNVTNVCADAFQVMSRNGCEKDGLDMSITNGYRVWMQRGADATEGRSCPAGHGEVKTLQQGDSIAAIFVWDGTFTDQACQAGNGAGCGQHYQAAAGTYRVTVTLDDTWASQTRTVTFNP